MNSYPEHIRLNGQKIGVAELIESNYSTEHQKKLAIFLKEWYSSSDYIETGSSGSTGMPKIIRLKKEFVIQSALRTINFFNLQPGDRILHCLPLNFIAGKLMVVRALAGNLDLSSVDPGTDFSFLQNKKFRFAAMVPHQVNKILETENKPGTWFNNLAQLLIGGSSLPHTLESRLQSIPTSCWSSYAMTETATHIALRKINGENTSEYYHCLEGITIQSSNEGCLQVFMPGLDKKPLTTTDLAEVKDEKTFRILGRADNVIISGGIKFSPEQLEKKLEPFIKEPFFISSMPHDSLGQQLVMVLQGKKKKDSIEKYWQICRNYLNKYEQPKQVIFITEIPKTINGKPDRRKLTSLLIREDGGDQMSGNVP